MSDSEETPDECISCIKESTLNSENKVDCRTCKRVIHHADAAEAQQQINDFKKASKRVSELTRQHELKLQLV